MIFDFIKCKEAAVEAREMSEAWSWGLNIRLTCARSEAARCVPAY